MIRGNAHAVVHLRTINQFLKLVYLQVVYEDFGPEKPSPLMIEIGRPVYPQTGWRGW